VKKASEYRQHAQECRALARNAKADEHRIHLLNMADTWENLAVERERMLQEKALPKTADAEPGAEYSEGTEPVPPPVESSRLRHDITAA
jgi:hypothetical protein